MIDQKTNFKRLLDGECPEWIPNYSIMAPPKDSGLPPPAIMLLCPEFLSKHRTVGVGGIDPWGVNYVYSVEMNGATMPDTRTFILDDITKWRDVIKAPDISGYDWKKIAKDNIENSGIDRSRTLLSFDLHFGYFQHLMSFMGFSEGLCAIYEEQEEVEALLNYICDFYIEITEKLIDYYQPDVLSLKDDTASLQAPFISPSLFTEILVPLYKRHAKFANDRGIPISFHNCGKSEKLIDELVEHVGIRLWDPAQTCNDLEAVKAKYGNKLVIAGGWDAKGRLLSDDASDEEIYESVRHSMVTLGKGGGYAFLGGFIPSPDPHVREVCARKNAVVQRAYEDLKYSVISG
ncbi:MAG: veratrol--corrinoid protein metyltransferase [Oscillospiraceae bacterium]|nr:veratrol--corrinoid protein metyltransferase [Oscillospiraceae bacterium]